ncbi:MAG: T9SS type A sorting domain-containing protein [candidate division WOR-3 bacterium]|nr:MAG: T9SS type A sorting domain-containing protein [candidate division WOR-3 bacterium]
MLVLFVFFSSTAWLYAQIPDTLWTRTYGGANHDIGYYVCPTYDSGFCVAGYTASFGGGVQNAYLLRLDSNGDTLWAKYYGGPSYDGAHCVLETEDNGFLVTGFVESYGAAGKNLYLIRTDPDGDTIWTKVYGGNLQDVGYALCPAHGGGFMVVGYRDGPTGWVKGNFWLLKIDTNGDTLWTRVYGGAGEDYGISIRPIPDGYIITGVNTYASAGGKDLWLVKTDMDGDTLWTRVYGGALEDVGYGVNTTADGGFIVTGYRDGSGSWTAGDLWLLKTDAYGDTLWTSVFGAGGEDFGFDVFERDDGYIIGGQYGYGSTKDVWLVRTDNEGDTLWTKRYGGIYDESALGMMITDADEFVLVGYTGSYGAGYNDVYVIKLEPETGIQEHDAVSHRNPYTTMIVNNLAGIFHDRHVTIFDIAGRPVTPTAPAPGIYFVEQDNVIIHKIILIR